jgi:hypothetical protein
MTASGGMGMLRLQRMKSARNHLRLKAGNRWRGSDQASPRRRMLGMAAGSGADPCMDRWQGHYGSFEIHATPGRYR